MLQPICGFFVPVHEARVCAAAESLLAETPCPGPWSVSLILPIPAIKCPPASDLEARRMPGSFGVPELIASTQRAEIPGAEQKATG